MKCPPEISDVPFAGFAVDLVRQIFEGDAPYNYGTPAHTVVMGILTRLRPLLRFVKVRVNGVPADLADILETTIGHYGVSDNNAVFRLH